MRLITPDSLHYPITVTRLLRNTLEEVDRNAPLFNYEYKSTVLEWSEDDAKDLPVVRTWPSTFESYGEGTLTQWLIKEGMVIPRPGVAIADLEEPCKHEVQFGGMCAECGKDMTTVAYNTVTRDTARATVNAVHGHTALLVSRAEASKSDEEAKRRLLSSRKLSLVVDLDQTIIHATVDPTVAEWQNDTSNPNHGAVKDVRAFQLVDDSPGANTGARACWYYIKLRPGLQEFLSTISKYYELHIYTMGTRAYAQNIAKIVDPERKIFADRILSRDESGSLTVKNLKRLFPVDTSMVVIIDDRGDVWHWSQNLIKVTPYDFFVGIGDINSSFLPKRPGLDASPQKPVQPAERAIAQDGAVLAILPPIASAVAPNLAPTAPTAPTVSTSISLQDTSDLSAIDQLVSMSGGNDPGKLQEQTSQQDEAIAAQLADRPLLQKQKMLDSVEDDANDANEDRIENDGTFKDDSSSEAHSKYRSNLLQDTDNELEYLQQSLRSIHQAFFDDYERGLAGLPGGRIAELRPGVNKKRSLEDLGAIPDVSNIMAAMKQKILKGVHLVFSGVVPLGVDIHSHDLAIWSKSFGATVSENITKRTTHVIASPQRRTAKVRHAAKKPDRIKIVTQEWLFQCLSQWSKVSENLYRIHNEVSDNGGKPATVNGSPFDGPEDNVPLSSSDEEATLTEEEADIPNGFDVHVEDDVDDEEKSELAKHMPTLSREDSSPHEETNEDWEGMNDELADFLGSEADDSESEAESTISKESTSADEETPSAKKRKREDAGLTSTEDEDSDASRSGSRLQKRKRKALARTTSLTSMAALTPLSKHEIDKTKTDVKASTDGGETPIDNDDDEEADAALEAELEAEMLRQAEESGDE